jgi:hypothetical protein
MVEFFLLLLLGLGAPLLAFVQGLIAALGGVLGGGTGAP